MTAARESRDALSHICHENTHPFFTPTAMPHQLSVGSCKLFQSVTPEDVDVFSSEHTVQLLSIKKVGNNPTASGPAPDRYRIIMSDGMNYMQAMLATQLNEMVQQDLIRKNTVVTLEKLTCNYVQDKRCAFKHVVVVGSS